MTRLLSAALLLALLAFPLASAHAAAPSFALNFVFRPALNQSPGTAPAFFLDSCSDQYCSAVQASAPLTCDMVANPATNLTAVTRCRLVYAIRRGRANPALGWLAGGSYVRLRNNAQMSQPFLFSGGAPSLPQTEYRYQAIPRIVNGTPVFQIVPR